ncbi:restriction endonuclease subunit S [Fusicatenibacter sp.]
MIPKLRFKDDNGNDFPAWNTTVRLEEISAFITKGATPTTYGFEWQIKGIYFFRNDCIKNNIFVYGDYSYISEEANEFLKRSEIRGDDIVIAITGDIGKVGLVPSKIKKANINQHLARIRIVKNAIPYFVYSYLSSNEIQRNYRKIKTGLSMAQLNLSQVRETRIPVVSMMEQRKIAEFLMAVDRVIETRKETVVAWQKRKKGLMQKIFSQEVRFKGKDGREFPEWRKKKFLEAFEILNNSTFSRECLNYESGDVKYIHYGDVLIKFGAMVDVQNSNVPYVNKNLNCEKYAVLIAGDIVIADTAEDDTVGKTVEIINKDGKKTISGLHTIACHPKEKFASKYLGYFMNSDEYHNQLRPYMQGIKVTSISKSNIALTDILMPCFDEQQKIAECLTAIDDVINNYKETLMAWQELKKGLMQQMFI